MDNAAIKAYSSVIADAAEDSEPTNPVIYTEIKDEARSDQRMSHAPMWGRRWYSLLTKQS